MKGNSQSSPRGAETLLQEKSKEKYIKTHINQANRRKKNKWHTRENPYN